MNVLGAAALIVVVAAACALAYAALRAVGARGALALSFVLAIALLAALPAQLCRVVGDLRISMALAAVLFALGAAALRKRARPDVEPLARPAWPALLVPLFAFGLVVHGAITRNFFDDEAHVPFSLVIARGIVPPEHPFAPGQVIPYHWGIDALYAQLVVAGVRPDTAIDVVTILCWPLFVAACAVIGAVLAGKRGATLAVIVVPLAGSLLAHPLHENMGALQVLANPYPTSWGEWFRRPPPITADFFQHPQGLAFPIVLAVLVLFTASTRGQRMLGAALLALLSISHSVHFLVLGFGLLVAALADGYRGDRRAAVVDVVMLAAALLCAPLLGGFFSPSAGTAGSLVWGTRFFGDEPLWRLIVHHLVVFGLPVLALPVVVRFAVRETEHARLRVAVVAGACIGLFLPNVVVYRDSWDIVKLYTAGSFLAAIALVDVLARFLDVARRVRVVLVVIAVLFTVQFPLTWLATRSVLKGRAGIPPTREWRLRDEVLLVGDLVKPHIPSRSRVLVGDLDYARMTGLFAPGFNAQKFINGHLIDFGRARALQPARDAALKHLRGEDLAALDVDFVLLTTREQRHLSAEGRARWQELPLVDVTLPDAELRRAR